MNARTQPPSTPLRHLLWKDERIIRPAAIMGLAMIGVFNLIGVLAVAVEPRASEFAFGVSATVCVGIPGLLAFASGPFLVAGEEETGTSSWLRSVPVSWQTILTSKLIVTASWTLALGVVATLTFALLVMSGAFETPLARTHHHHEIKWLAVTGLTLYSMLVILLVSLSISYLFRSGLTSLIAAFITAFLFLGVASQCQDLLVTRPQTIFDFIAVIIYWGILLVGWFMLLILLAKRRMTSQETAITRHLKRVMAFAYPPKQNALETAYRPSAHVGLRPPTPVYAIAWQQYRHIFWIGTPLVLGWLTLRPVIFFGIYGQQFYQGNQISLTFLLPILMTILGVLAFYRDGCKDQVRFFADRGISLKLIWGIHVGSTALYAGVAMLTALQFQSDLFFFAHGPFLFCCIIAWCFGVLASQVVYRPALAFFAAPIATYLAFPVILPITMGYPEYVWVGVLPILILITASWRLFPQFVNGNRGKRFEATALGYCVFALISPTIFTLGLRWISTPSIDQEFHQKVAAMGLPQGSPTNNTYFAQRRLAHDRSLSAEENLIRQLKAELESDDLLGEVSMNDLFEIAGYDLMFRPAAYSRYRSPEVNQEQGAELVDLATEVLLRWAARVRQDVLAGNANLVNLSEIAEQAEALAASMLLFDRRYYPSRERWKQLIELFPDDDLRLKSRRVAVAQQWQRYQSEDSDGKIKTFADLSVNIPPYSSIWIERERTDRAVDEAVKFSLQQLESGQNFEQQGDQIKMMQLWDKACFGPMAPREMEQADWFVQEPSGNYIKPFSKFLRSMIRIKTTEEKIRKLKQYAK